MSKTRITYGHGAGPYSIGIEATAFRRALVLYRDGTGDDRYVSGSLLAVDFASGCRAPLSALAAAHGIVFFAWLLLFLVQSRLIATRHVAFHRRVGLASVFILTLMIPLAYTTPSRWSGGASI
jgi:hypothetical protein